MFPCISAHYHTNVAMREAEPDTDLRVRQGASKTTHLPDLLFGNFRISVAFASAHSTLQHRVDTVVGVRSFKQMFGIDAASYVTFMQYVQYRPSASSEKVRNSMRRTVSADAFMHHIKSGISVLLRYFVGPFPAIAPRAKPRCFINLAMESLNVLVGKRGRDYINFSHHLNSLSILVRSFGLLKQLAASLRVL